MRLRFPVDTEQSRTATRCQRHGVIDGCFVESVRNVYGNYIEKQGIRLRSSDDTEN